MLLPMIKTHDGVLKKRNKNIFGFLLTRPPFLWLSRHNLDQISTKMLISQVLLMEN